MRAVPLLLALLPAIAGCRETHHCELDQSFQNGMCRPYGGDGSSGFDAGRDTGSDDAGNDAGHDAFDPCATCGTTEVCSNSGDAGVDGGTPRCVECVVDGDCDAVALPWPDSGVTDGGMPPGTPICENFHCVRGCRGDSDCGTGGGVCRPDQRCSAYPAYAAADVTCAPCDTDTNCGGVVGFLCMPFTYNNGLFMHPGNYCLLHAATCGAITAPLNVSALGSTSIDGTSVADMVCAPSTSCEALRDADSHRSCMGGTVDCGIVGTSDGLCSTADICTFRCDSNDDCPTHAARCVGATTPLCIP